MRKCIILLHYAVDFKPHPQLCAEGRAIAVNLLDNLAAPLVSCHVQVEEAVYLQLRYNLVFSLFRHVSEFFCLAIASFFVHDRTISKLTASAYPRHIIVGGA